MQQQEAKGWIAATRPTYILQGGPKKLAQFLLNT